MKPLYTTPPLGIGTAPAGQSILIVDSWAQASQLTGAEITTALGADRFELVIRALTEKDIHGLDGDELRHQLRIKGSRKGIGCQ